MYCMKCGKKIEDSQVFCDDCLSVMAKYPVKPDVAVHLPKRKAVSEKPARKKELTPEQLQQYQQSLIKWLFLTVLILTAVVCLLGWLLIDAYGGLSPLFGLE